MQDIVDPSKLQPEPSGRASNVLQNYTLDINFDRDRITNLDNRSRMSGQQDSANRQSMQNYDNTPGFYAESAEPDPSGFSQEFDGQNAQGSNGTFSGRANANFNNNQSTILEEAASNEEDDQLGGGDEVKHDEAGEDGRR